MKSRKKEGEKNGGVDIAGMSASLPYLRSFDVHAAANPYKSSRAYAAVLTSHGSSKVACCGPCRSIADVDFFA